MVGLTQNKKARLRRVFFYYKKIAEEQALAIFL